MSCRAGLARRQQLRVSAWLAALGAASGIATCAHAESLNPGFEASSYSIRFTADGTPYTPPSNLFIANGLAQALRDGQLTSQAFPQAIPPDGSPEMPTGVLAGTREVAPPPAIAGVDTAARDRPSGSGVPAGSLYQEPGASQALDLSPPSQSTIGAAPQGEPDIGRRAVYQDGIYVIKRAYLESWLENSWRIVSGPARFDEGDWMNVALVAGITGGLMIADNAVKELWQDDVRSGTTDDVFDVLNELGDFYNIVYGSIGAYAISEALGAKREKAASLMALESVVMAALITKGINYVSGRERPNSADDSLNFQGPPGTDEFDGFPSGHATHAFALASVLSEVYGPDNPWVPWVADTTAGGVALARINDNKHWASDVFLGSAIGIFVGKLVTRFNPFLEANGVEIQAFNQGEASGVSFNIPF